MQCGGGTAALQENREVTARFKHFTLPASILMLRLHLKLASWEQSTSSKKRALVTKVGYARSRVSCCEYSSS